MGTFFIGSALTLFLGDKWRHMRRSPKCPLHPDMKNPTNLDEESGFAKNEDKKANIDRKKIFFGNSARLLFHISETLIVQQSNFR